MTINPKSIVETLINNYNFEAIEMNGKTVFKYLAENPDKITMLVDVRADKAVTSFNLNIGAEARYLTPYLVHDFSKIKNAEVFTNSLIELANELENTDWKFNRDYINISNNAKNNISDNKEALKSAKKIITDKILKELDRDNFSGLMNAILSVSKDIIVTKLFNKETPLLIASYLLAFQIYSVDNADILTPFKNLGTEMDDYKLSPFEKEDFKNIIESQVLKNKALESKKSPTI